LVHSRASSHGGCGGRYTLAKLPGLIRKLRVMTDWTFDLVFPAGHSQLLPPPDEIVRAVHLEKGDPLFEMGSPCRSFFFVAPRLAGGFDAGTAGEDRAYGQRHRPE